MARTKEIECDVVRDPTTDSYLVRLRRYEICPRTGEISKSGVMFRVTDEDFFHIAEGQEYVKRRAQDIESAGKEIIKEGKQPPNNRWEAIMEETEDVDKS